MEKFQVDLRGILEILSRHLYSSPRVFVRELLQNGVDAITARRQIEPNFRGALEIAVAPDQTVTFADDGIGLTADEVRNLLATIGRSSKRDELDMQRDGFLGQFGIGLLSCFLVSEEIEVRTRSAREPDAPTMLWVGRGDGTYALREADEPLGKPGTVVTLRPRPDEHWLGEDSVHELAVRYGALLPTPVVFIGANRMQRTVAPQRAPWQMNEDDQIGFCERAFGFEPLAIIPLNIPAAGLTGVGFVMPDATAPSDETKHRAYLRRMLLSDSVAGLVPEWASFLRVVVAVEHLRPTASRESLYDDATLKETRRQLSKQLREWMVTTGASEPALLREFIETHNRAFTSAALADDDVLPIAREWLQWETTTGTATVAEMLRGANVLRYTTTTSAYAALRQVAAARGAQVINGGYADATALLRRFGQRDSSITLQPTGLSHLIEDDGAYEAALAPIRDAGTQALAEFYCELSMGSFEPRSTPALHVSDPERAMKAREQTRASTISADPLLAGFLDFTTNSDEDDDTYDVPFDTLVLNAANPVVGQLPHLDHDLQQIVLRNLYLTARLAAGSRFTGNEGDALSDSLFALVERAHR